MQFPHRSPLVMLALLAPLGLLQPQEEPADAAPALQKITPVLCCEALEPCLAFWVEQLGFEVTLSLPASEDEEGALGFAILNHGPVKLMLQTYSSLGDSLPEFAESARDAPSFLFIEVADIDDIVSRLGDTEVVTARHDTFYGSTELTVRSPGGHLVTLAQMTGG